MVIVITIAIISRYDGAQRVLHIEKLALERTFAREQTRADTLARNMNN